MEQKLVKKNDLMESLELDIILLKYNLRLEHFKQKQRDIEEARKEHELYELYKTFNPRYSENIIPLKEAKHKVDSSDVIYSSRYNFFRPY
ncbi:MAG: hypothetical protein ACFFG0_24870 [Candidatus Thorarchaeota archaeon]